MVVARGDEIDAEIVLMSLLFIKNKIARSRSHNRATPVQRERLTYYLQVIHDRDAVDHRRDHLAVNGRCTPVEFHTFMKESFDAEIRLPVHTHQTSAIVSKRGESSKEP